MHGLPGTLQRVHGDRPPALAAGQLVSRQAYRQYQDPIVSTAAGVAHVRSFLSRSFSTVATFDARRPLAPRRQSPLMENVILTESRAILFQHFRTTARTSSHSPSMHVPMGPRR